MHKALAGQPSSGESARHIELSRSLRGRFFTVAATFGVALALSACGFVHRDSGSDAAAATAQSASAQDSGTVADAVSPAASPSQVVQTSAPSASDTGTVSRPSGSTTTTVAGKTNSVDIIVNDMMLNNDLTLAGIPIERGWATGTGQVVMGNDPRGSRTPTWWNPYNQYYKSGVVWTHFVPWMAIFDGVGNAASNTRVELRTLKSYYKSRSTGQWILISEGSIDGQNFPKYLNAVSSGAPDIRPIGGGAVSVLPPGTDLHFHGWCCGRALPAPSDIAAIHITIQARLAVHDANRPDDRARARYLVQVGGDYYPDASLNLGVFTPVNWNPGIGLSRSKLLGNDWQSFSFTTIDVGSQDPGGASISVAELRRAPPPLD